MNTAGDQSTYITELLMEIDARGRRNDELRREINEQNALITELREEVEDLSETLQNFKDTFDLVPADEPDTVTNAPLVDRLDEALEKRHDMLRKYNDLIRFVRARVFPRSIGRPLACSDEQRKRILAYRKAGKSLRSIAEEMNLGLQTVRTVIDKKDRKDRTTLDRWQQIEPDMRTERDRRRRRKDVDALRKRIPRLMEDSAELIKRAKGLK
jgi:DNA-binding NarL/FixJ family response regulator